MTPVAGALPRLVQHRPGAVLSRNLPALPPHRATARDGFVCPECWSHVRFIRPPFCDRCGLPFEGDLTTKFECTNCRELELHFSSARSAVVAKTRRAGGHSPVQILARACGLKIFSPTCSSARPRRCCAEQKWDFIVPVPLHPLKLREREFNQAARLAAPAGPRDENSAGGKNSPPRSPHRHADPAHARAARRKHEKRLRRPPRREAGRPAHACSWTTFSPPARRPAPAPGRCAARARRRFASGQWHAGCDLYYYRNQWIPLRSRRKRLAAWSHVEPALTPPPIHHTQTTFAKKPKLDAGKLQDQETRHSRRAVDQMPVVRHDDFRQGAGRKPQGLPQVPASFPHRLARTHPFPRRNLHLRGDGRRHDQRGRSEIRRLQGQTGTRPQETPCSRTPSSPASAKSARTASRWA